MDHHSILEHGSTTHGSTTHGSTTHSSTTPAAGVVQPGAPATRTSISSVSAQIAAVTAHPPKSSETPLRLLADDGNHSLAQMASSDLDAALQLLAERAQYITGASGAAIALRRGEHNDMLCRASAGSNAPELGALLSMEYGLSGESLRKRQALRCDDAERDPRVNREGCRRLGISSVVVMPIMSDQQALGVFELFSGNPRAFGERDLSALQRLSEMTRIAVQHAVAAQTSGFVQSLPDFRAAVDVAAVEAMPVDAIPVVSGTPQRVVQNIELQKPEQTDSAPQKKPLFWSAALRRTDNPAPVNVAAESIAVPPMLRNLQKCQACGFPVSQGRTLCVECEEKQWRGQPLPQPAAARPQAIPEPQVTVVARDIDAVLVTKDSPRQAPSGTQESISAPLLAAAAVAGAGGVQTSISPAIDHSVASRPSVEAPVSSGAAERSSSPTNLPTQPAENISADAPPPAATPFLSSSLESPSWFAAHKYVLGALVVVAIVIGAIAWLR